MNSHGFLYREALNWQQAVGSNLKTLLIFVGVAVAAVAIGIVIGFSIGSSGSSDDPSPNPDDCLPDCAPFPVNNTRYWLTGESYQAYKDCKPGNCSLATLNGSTYIMKGDAHKAYLGIENIAQMHLMGIDLRYLDDTTGYLISIEGHNRTEVERLVRQYNVSEEIVQLHPTATDWKGVYGPIYKEDLARLSVEVDGELLNERSVTIARVGQVTGDNGKTIVNPFRVNTEVYGNEYEKVTENEIARVVAEESGVTRINESDLLRARIQPREPIP